MSARLTLAGDAELQSKSTTRYGENGDVRYPQNFGAIASHFEHR